MARPCDDRGAARGLGEAMYGPVIQGKLVRLRPPNADDALAIVSWFDDLETTRFLGRRNPPSVETEKEWLEIIPTEPASGGWGVAGCGRGGGATGMRRNDW